MSVNDQSTASRQFVASAAAYSSKWIKGTRYWQAGYTVFFVAFVAFAVLTVFGPLWGVHVLLLVVAPAGFFTALFLNHSVFGSYDAYGEVPIPGTATLHLPQGPRKTFSGR